MESFFLCRVVMATNEQLALEDLGKVHRLVETQGQLMTKDAVDQLATVWERKINGLNLSADMAFKFVEQLKQGPWSDQQKKGLITAINSSVLKNTTSSPNRRKLQDIPNFSPFLSKNDLEVLANANVPLQNKIDQVVCRMVRLGMHCPSEPSVGRIVVVMMKLGVVTGKNDGNDTWALVKEVKRLLKCKINGLPKDQEHIVQYPATPAELPEWLQKRAYDEQDGPVESALSLFDLSDAKVALRSNSKLLPKNQQPSSVVPHQSSSSSTGVDVSNPMAMMQMQMMSFWQNMANMMNPETQTSNFNLNLMRPPDKTQQKALPAPPTAVPLQDSQTEDSQEQKIDKTPMEDPPTAKTAVELPTPTPPQQPLALPAPPQKALELPDLSAEGQVKAVLAAVGHRAEVKDAKKADGVAASSTEPVKTQEKAKAKAKAKNKSGLPKSKAKAPAKAKASAKAEAKSKAKSQPKVENAALPKAKAKANALAKAEPKSNSRPKHKPAPKQDRVIYNKDNMPPTPEEGSGTVWYCSGKIHRNAKEWRVFMDCSDRVDKKVKIGENPDESFRRCLTLIDANDVD